ncbi:hypothetical protein HPB49_006121 [Dermacentor silvarum]|uniref:Uncharacterized protein n=1 Tax=Dermacentor silvarum TaxID=543639 RepID=A0ACB8D3C8_DERSI|nr:hypothetical protein HPB49_006121 [Dermacentor silvarum]
MVYCSVPHCKSQSSRTKGVSFHQFPSDAELVAKWLKNISRENLVVNDKSASTVVCSRHFLSTDYVPGCQIRKLLPGVVPTVFDEYPSYLVPSAKKPHKEPASRCSVPAPKPSKRKAEPEGAVDLPESQDDFADKKHSVCTQTANKDAQRVSAYVSLIGRLRKQAAYHRSKCSKLQQQLDAARKANAFYRENKRHASVKEIVADSAKGEKKAIFLLHQLDSYGQKRPCYPEEIIRECVVWRFLSPKGYDHARTSQLLTLPAKCTLQRYMGPSPTTTGMSPAMRERLVFEASLLSSKQHMATLIIDEASIKPKCIYDKKSDAVFGLRDKPSSDTPGGSKETLANRVLCFVLHGIASSYRIPCSYYFTKQLSGRDLFAWTKEVINAVESCGFLIVRIVTDNYSANTTMFKLMGNGYLSTVVEHPHDDNRVIFLSFDPCHVLKNVRSQFLERELTDGVGDISGIFVQKLYEHQKDMTVKLARNLTKKHVYPTNLEKMNVLRAVQTFSPQVIAAIEHLQENTGGDSTLYAFSKASSTIHFMKTIKRWFDIHDTTYAGSGQKSPISNTDDPRLLWLANEFTSYIEGIQENSKARGKDGFTCETFEALRFTTKSTVETARFLLRNGVNCVLTRKLNSDPIEAIFGRIRFMCGGNDMLDARAVTTALDHIIKSETSIGKKLTIPCGDAEELAAALPQSLTEELNDLAEYPDTPSPSVTYSGLVYVAGYIAKLISDFECDACSILLETHERSDPL